MSHKRKRPNLQFDERNIGQSTLYESMFDALQILLANDPNLKGALPKRIDIITKSTKPTKLWLHTEVSLNECRNIDNIQQLEEPETMEEVD